MPSASRLKVARAHWPHDGGLDVRDEVLVINVWRAPDSSCWFIPAPDLISSQEFYKDSDARKH